MRKSIFLILLFKLKERMEQVEGFYSEILNKPFDFNIKEEINLD